ncbi:sigma-70 family RNA polymerase sigma factor [Asanoa sp. WMMD1127]|uniref:sigma-70 family RNA polymerase sigma factor n=1 Tax=Asanoa sp. WMMD1127 TaxID=3016107 RepID=UPI002417D1D6|nr:sigma-70 family RNA polymerase sigma factor [Asanoa sp. WMMD1127]MDG4823188.1 sigma-70 family RNA polymerase sigma factor [Asanoa sp. WMMD1127]
MDLLAASFEENRAHLRAVAYRMLGSAAEADDAVQETWLRLRRTDTAEVDNLGGWLTTVVGRICLDMLRSRRARREEPLDGPAPATQPDPEQEALLADAVGPALLVVLDSLSPAERLAFVLHDLFAVPFEEVASIVGRSPAATRQLASRARRRVRGQEPLDADQQRQRTVVTAFLAAARNGEFEGLLALLDPGAVVRAEGAEPVLGADAVARTFCGRAEAARIALVDGQVGAVWAKGGRPQVVFRFTVDAAGHVTAIDLRADQAELEGMEIEYL